MGKVKFMTVRRRTLVLLAIALCVWAIIATGFAGYYQIRYMKVTKAFEEIEESIIQVDVLIDYGNGTQVWHNETKVVTGSTPLDALLIITKNVEFKKYDGKYITGIDGRVEGENSGWTWWFWNTEKSDWDYSLEAVDEYILHSDEIIKFQFVSW
jgi:hypothetical protein